MGSLEFWQLMSILIGICSVLIGPTIWYFREQTKTSNKKTEDLSNKTDEKLHDHRTTVDNIIKTLSDNHIDSQNQTRLLIEQINHNHREDAMQTRNEIKEFRGEINEKITMIYEDLKDYVSNEISIVRKSIDDINNKIDVAREKNHEIEKSLMEYQNEVQRNFVSREHLDAVIELRMLRNERDK